MVQRGRYGRRSARARSPQIAKGTRVEWGPTNIVQLHPYKRFITSHTWYLADAPDTGYGPGAQDIIISRYQGTVIGQRGSRVTIQPDAVFRNRNNSDDLSSKFRIPIRFLNGHLPVLGRTVTINVNQLSPTTSATTQRAPVTRQGVRSGGPAVSAWNGDLGNVGTYALGGHLGQEEGVDGGDAATIALATIVGFFLGGSLAENKNLGSALGAGTGFALSALVTGKR